MVDDAKPVPTFALATGTSRIGGIGTNDGAIYMLRRGHDSLSCIGSAGGRQMAKKGLDGRHRDTTGRIDKKHGNTRVGTDMMLKTLLVETGTDSLHAYLRKHHK
jgi:hypothetical protein